LAGLPATDATRRPSPARSGGRRRPRSASARQENRIRHAADARQPAPNAAREWRPNACRDSRLRLRVGAGQIEDDEFSPAGRVPATARSPARILSRPATGHAPAAEERRGHRHGQAVVPGPPARAPPLPAGERQRRAARQRPAPALGRRRRMGACPARGEERAVACREQASQAQIAFARGQRPGRPTSRPRPERLRQRRVARRQSTIAAGEVRASRGDIDRLCAAKC
jgi:hypothetical protein